MGAGAPHGLKYAVLGLVIEHRGYAYRLAQRLEELVGDAYELNPSAVYTALNQLESADLIEIDERASVGATRRSPRVVYAATVAGRAVFETWITTPPTKPDPIRFELVRKLAVSKPDHGERLLGMIERAELECLDRIEAATLRMGQTSGADRWDATTNRLVHQYGIRQLHARLEWLRDAHAAVQRLTDEAAASDEVP
ncbi:PadR family transcriptional regulator [Conexibacter sp. CPCC 206217]|uniref:PadR family transcriptional regulator n=1 Tax=Conexibacter sp. CPCC 206217 TaxID=3064574 RepID=UPI002715AA05|nr:PadR family transcriptional regulator [Conexibacter sp. CPCC 206217]MDO8209654.1 PadR family transcriptional regulator [Conexibacter sp. CPCC 206217]